MDNNIKLPYEIGSTVYIVENFNSCYDLDNGFVPIHTIYNSDIVIKPIGVKGYIIDKHGISLAEDGWDGWNKLNVYHNLDLAERCEDCKIFGTKKEAEDFVNSIKEGK